MEINFQKVINPRNILSFRHFAKKKIKNKKEKVFINLDHNRVDDK